MSSPNIWSLDVETKDLITVGGPYALEPFRVKQGKAIITDISIAGPDNFSRHIDTLNSTDNVREVKELVSFLKGKVVYMHNAVFDTAWLYATIDDVIPLANIKIRDTMLLAKWILNGQKHEYDSTSKLDLLSLCVRFLPEHPQLEKFVEIKSEKVDAGADPEYWSERVVLDAIMTRDLAVKLQEVLPEAQRNGFMISQKSIPYVSRSWVDGAPFDHEKVKELQPKIAAGKQKFAADLGVPTTCLNSPAQLSNLLFNDWGLTPENYGKPNKKTGIAKGSTAAGDLKMIALKSGDVRMQTILKYKKLQTLQVKYLNGFERVVGHVGEAVCHGSPRMFGTYTGRYTYSSKTQRKQLFQTSIAMHQLPRKGPAKGLMLPPEGYDVGKYDASGQEIAFMALMSGDVNMASVLCQGMNVHSWMATNINGEDYESFIKKVHEGDSEAYNTRQAAKLLNLSCQYRIGGTALKRKFFETYDKIISDSDSYNYLNMYKSAYPGVVDYWKWICTLAQEQGYAETIGRRRYHLSDWGSHRWGTESSAINTPIQGSGADQKDLIIWLVSEQFPEARFSLDIHDEGIFFLPSDCSKELNTEIVHFLNGIDYEKYWQREIPIPLTFEGQLGKNFKDCVEYAQPHKEIQTMRKDLNVRTFGDVQGEDWL